MKAGVRGGIKSTGHKLILYLPGHFTDAIHANIDRSFLQGSLPSQFCACQRDTKSSQTAFPADR